MCVCVQEILFLRNSENELICLFWATYRECKYTSSFAEQFGSWKNFIFFLEISKPIKIFCVDSKCESDLVGFWLEKCLPPKIDFVCATRYKSMLYFHKKFGDLPFPYWVFGSVFLFIIWTILYFLDEFIIFSEKWGIGPGSQCDKFWNFLMKMFSLIIFRLLDSKTYQNENKNIFWLNWTV